MTRNDLKLYSQYIEKQQDHINIKYLGIEYSCHKGKTGFGYTYKGNCIYVSSGTPRAQAIKAFWDDDIRNKIMKYLFKTL